MAAQGKKMNAAALKALRQNCGMSQDAFWTKIGVSQSGGSRYENGRRIPAPVAQLIDLVHVRGIDTAKLKREDMVILQFTEDNHPDLYETLLKSVRDTRRKTRRA